MRLNLERDYSPENSWDRSLFCTSLAELRLLQKQKATILFGHDDAQWNTLRKGSNGYD